MFKFAQNKGVLKFGLVMLPVMLIAGLIVMRTVVTTDHAVGQWFYPQDTLHGVVAAVVESMHRKADLVVCRLHVTAWVHLSRSTHWLGIYWGTTSAHVTSYGNRVQFVERLGRLTPDDFTYDAARQTLTCRFPPPVLDTGMVQLQPDPSKVVVHGSNGWALFNRGSVERKAKARLRAAVIVQAQKKFLNPLVRARACRTLKDFLQTVVHPLAPNLHICVRFSGPASL